MSRTSKDHMPAKTNTAPPVAWENQVGTGRTGTVYRIQRVHNQRTNQVSFIPEMQNAKGTFDELPGFPDEYDLTKSSAKRAIAEHERGLITELRARKAEARSHVSEHSRFGHLYALADMVEDADLSDEIHDAIDELRIETVDNVRGEYWVFDGAPLRKFVASEHDAMEKAGEFAGEQAEEKKGLASIVTVERQKLADGTWFAPALIAQYRGVVLTTEAELIAEEN